jgi:hypothetical protein
MPIAEARLHRQATLAQDYYIARHASSHRDFDRVSLSPRGIMPGVVVTALWFTIFSQYHTAFYGIVFSETLSDRAR